MKNNLMYSVEFIWPYDGDFNLMFASSVDNWIPHMMELFDPHPDGLSSYPQWIINVDLLPGKHEYKYIVDRVWMHDETQAAIINSYGTYNNVIYIEHHISNTNNAKKCSHDGCNVIVTSDNHKCDLCYIKYCNSHKLDLNCYGKGILCKNCHVSEDDDTNSE